MSSLPVCPPSTTRAHALLLSNHLVFLLLSSWVLYFSYKAKRGVLKLGYKSPGLFTGQGSTLYRDVVKEASLTGSTNFLPSSLCVLFLSQTTW